MTEEVPAHSEGVFIFLIVGCGVGVLLCIGCLTAAVFFLVRNFRRNKVDGDTDISLMDEEDSKNRHKNKHVTLADDLVSVGSSKRRGDHSVSQHHHHHSHHHDEKNYEQYAQHHDKRQHDDLFKKNHHDDHQDKPHDHDHLQKSHSHDHLDKSHDDHEHHDKHHEKHHQHH